MSIDLAQSTDRPTNLKQFGPPVDKQNVSAAIDNLDGCFNRLDSLVEMARVIADRINGGAPRNSKPAPDTPEGSLIATAQARVRRANHIAEDLARELEQIQKGLWA
jgi:hypothetical protein